MRLSELTKSGLYVYVSFSEKTQKQFKKYFEKLDLENPVPISELHTTIVYSRKYIDFETKDYTIKINPKTYEFRLFGENENCLVIKFESKTLKKRWQDAIDAGAQFDYDEYHPHVTLSYDFKGDIDNLDLPDFQFEIIGEFAEDLDPNWEEKIS